MKSQTRDAWNALPRWVKRYLIVNYCLLVGLIAGVLGFMLEPVVGLLPAMTIAGVTAFTVGVVSAVITERDDS